MQLQYGDISAWCQRCGSQQFELLAPEKGLQAKTVFGCLSCGAKAAHGDLLCQIGDEAVRRANDAMALLKARHAEHRKRIALLRGFQAQEDAKQLPCGREGTRDCFLLNRGLKGEFFEGPRSGEAGAKPTIRSEETIA